MKSRLTITLPDTLLQQIDGLVDKETIRNRSHAIEHLIRKSLSPQVSCVMILAGGKREHAIHPLLQEINGEKLLHILLKHVQIYGIKQVIFCLPDGFKKIEEICGDGKKLGVQISYSYEKKPLGTAGALKKAAHHLKTENPFLVIHADVLTDIKLDEVFDFHLKESATATIVVKPKVDAHEYGQVYIQGNRITTFSESSATSGISIINTGLYILNPSVFDSIPTGKESFLEADLFPALAKKNQLRAYFFQGIWHNVSSKKNFDEARLSWSKR